MLSALAGAAVKRPRAMLVASVGVLILCALLAAAAPDRLALAPPEAANSQSEDAADSLRGAPGQEPDPAILIVTRGPEPVSSGVYGVALDVITSQVESNSEVAEVRRGPVSRDRRTTALEVYFRDDDPAAQARAVDRLRERIDPGPLEVLVGGEAGVLRDARDGLWGELVPLELLALPLTALALWLALGLRLVAGPVLAAAIGMLGSLGVMGLAGSLTTLSVIGAAPGAVIAVVLGIESCLALTARYREQSAALGPGGEALRETMATAGRGVIAAALGCAAAAGTLAAIPILDARSAALGGALAALLSAAAALVAMPSLLVLSHPKPVRAGASGRGEGGRSYRFAAALTRRRLVCVPVALLATAALLAIAFPALEPETVPVDATGLADGAEARRAEVRATVELGTASGAPLLVSIPRARGEELERLRRELGRVAGVEAVESRPGAGSERELLQAGTEARTGSLGARDSVESVRDAPGLADAAVGGRDAEALDADRAFLDWLPIAAGAGTLLLALVLFAVLRDGSGTLRSVPPALALAVASMLPAAASAGLLMLVFQDGHLTGPLGYTPQGAPVQGAVVAVLAAIAAISAARSVRFAATSAEPGVPGSEPLARAASLTLTGAAVATLVAAAASFALVGSDVLIAKQFGLGTGAGLVVDLVLLRALLAPSLARITQ
jgi:RND superfamily putative drug exporter